MTKRDIHVQHIAIYNIFSSMKLRITKHVVGQSVPVRSVHGAGTGITVVIKHRPRMSTGTEITTDNLPESPGSHYVQHANGVLERRTHL